MIRNYLKTALRTITRSASYTIINVSGLTLGIVCALIIFSLVTFHLSFDNFHPSQGRLYRFVTEQHRDEVSYAGSVPPAFGNAFKTDYTFGENLARVYTLHEVLISFSQGNENKKFTEQASFADPEFFEIFNFPLATGTPNSLRGPNTAIITKKTAKKYFGDESPLDKTLRLDNRIDFLITGVLEDVPGNTEFTSEIYFSYATIGQYDNWVGKDDSWGGITTQLQTFVRLRAGVDPREVEAALPEYTRKYRPNSKNLHVYKLQPVSDIHFNASYGGAMPRTAVIVLMVVGAFLIITACLNFINLATAQALTRAKEVGVRKTLGSGRALLFWQFATETGMIVLLSTIVAIAFTTLLIPFVNELLNTRVRFDLMSNAKLLVFIPLLVIAVTFLSCFYPGIILSNFRPVAALKGKLSETVSGNLSMRKTLITAQFVIAQLLLISLIVVVYQMNYFKQRDLGFDKEGIVMIPLGSQDEKMKTVKHQLEAIPGVENVSACFAVPSSGNRWTTTMTFDNRSEAENFAVTFRGADEDYLSTFGLTVVAGRNLTPSDTVREFLVNETLVQRLFTTPEEILGKNLRVNGDWAGPIVGVVKDFHDQSLHADISPVFLTTQKNMYNSYAVRLNLATSKETLAAIEKLWTEMYPELIYTYDYVDNLTAEFYETEKTILRLIEVFAFIALFIGCMGLYGLVSFMSLRKTKEIGIRKVLGGSVGHILWIFGKEFTRLIAIAFIIAAPIAWLLMSRWLELYAYKVDLNIWIFAAELVVIATIVLLTVGFKAAQAALMNPVKALRTE